MLINDHIRMFFLVLFVLSVSPLSGHLHAEDVKPLNPTCGVCPVVISYAPHEAREILGKQGMNLVLRLKDKSIKIDVDNLTTIGAENDTNTAYDLQVYAQKNQIVINAIQDLSSIKINTDFAGLQNVKKFDEWMPEIQLTPSNGNGIGTTDDLQSAWKKMKSSSIYQIGNNHKNHEMWKKNLAHMIITVMETVER